VLPELAARRNARRTLAIWCAACSTGQEVWSTAITIRERVDDLQGWTIRILATDVSQAMVERTRAATYTDQELARGMPARLRSRYFTRAGDRWQARADLRAMVEVTRANLLDPAPSARRFDLILVRNVLIYFDAAGKRRALDAIHGALAPDGALLIGTGENLTDPRYEPRTSGRTVVYRPRGTRAPPPLRPWSTRDQRRPRSPDHVEPVDRRRSRRRGRRVRPGAQPPGAARSTPAC
jgi:chemotaxis protein methyltransferase CheR